MKKQKAKLGNATKPWANDVVRKGPTVPSSASRSQHGAACFSCRSAKQKCDRLEPCTRCIAQSRPCRYPAMSNRGRKEGCLNKPETAEKLLLRISQSPVGEEVVQIILNSVAAASQANALPDSQSNALETDKALSNSAPALTSADQCHLPPTECAKSCTHAPEPKKQTAAFSPLDILTAAITASSNANYNGMPSQGVFPSRHTLNSLPPSLSLPTLRTQEHIASDVNLVTYFAALSTPRPDWQVLAEQPAGCTFKLDAITCDPVASQIIDEVDSRFFFQQFFANQNQVIGLLDPELHTPENVYATSFTLFSVICALGCACSTRPRDKIIYHGLLQLAEGNVQWCIAASVTSLETIQAILLMYHWAPLRHSRLSDDPSRLNLSHAVQVARLTKINAPERVAKYIQASNLATDVDISGRAQRNYERCWLCLFNADKSFCGIEGPHLGISWNEVPKAAHEWWRQAGALQSDQLVSGIVETRGILFNALNERHGANATSASISSWHDKWFQILDHVRSVRCSPDSLLSTTLILLLEFHIDHAILMLGAHAVREPLSNGAAAVSVDVSTIYERSAKVAIHMLDTILNNQSLLDLIRSFYNSQFIIICHALVDLRVALVENALPQDDATKALSAARAMTNYLNTMAKDLPLSSVAKLYASLAQSLVDQVEQCNLASQTDSAIFTAAILGLDSWSHDWWPTEFITGHDNLAEPQDCGNAIFQNVDYMRVREPSNTTDAQ